MRGIRYFIWLAEQSFDCMVYLIWPAVFPALLVLLCLALGADIYRKKLRLADIGASLLPLLATVLILASGVVFRIQPAYSDLPFAGLLLCLLLSIAVLVWRRRVWPTALAVSLLVLWYSLSCAFVSVMSITDDWL